MTRNFEEQMGNFLTARERLNSLPVTIDVRDEDVACAAHTHCEAAMITTPAQSIDEFRVKFDVCCADPQSTIGRDYLLALFADLRRLTGQTESPIFNPERWLAYYEKRGGMFCVRGDEVFLLSPEGADLEDPLLELEALGGREAVNALIRERAVKEADNG